MTHGKREQAKFRAGSMRRKLQAQSKQDQAFNQETERLVRLYSEQHEKQRHQEAKRA